MLKIVMLLRIAQFVNGDEFHVSGDEQNLYEQYNIDSDLHNSIDE